MADGGATVRQAFGAHSATVAAVLRTALWAVEWPATPVGAAGERGDLGSVAGRGAGGAFRAGPVRDQTGEPVALGNPDSHRNMGFEPTRVSGSRQRGPLWRESGREFHLEPDLHGHAQRLDRRRGGVEQRRRRRAGGHTPGGGAPAFRVAGIRFGQRRGIFQSFLVVLHSRGQRPGGGYPFPTLPLRRQRACGAKKLDVGPATFGLWTLGRPGVGGADQRAVSGGMGPVAELLFALFEIGAEVAAGKSLAQAL